MNKKTVVLDGVEIANIISLIEHRIASLTSLISIHEKYLVYPVENDTFDHETQKELHLIERVSLTHLLLRIV